MCSVQVCQSLLQRCSNLGSPRTRFKNGHFLRQAKNRSELVKHLQLSSNIIVAPVCIFMIYDAISCQPASVLQVKISVGYLCIEILAYHCLWNAPPKDKTPHVCSHLQLHCNAIAMPLDLPALIPHPSLAKT